MSRYQQAQRGRGAYRNTNYGYQNYNEDEQQPPPRKNFPKNRSQVNRDKKRMDDHRERKGTEAMETLVKKSVEDTLFRGFSSVKDLLEDMGQTYIKNPSGMSVTTRGIGFGLFTIFKSAYQTINVRAACTIFQAYRVSLAQFELRMIYNRRGQGGNMYVEPGRIYEPSLNFDAQQMIKGCAYNFNIIANVIRSAGNFEFGGQKYCCFVPQGRGLAPLNVTYGSLGATVRMLSNPNSSVEARQRFYNLNCLPGARWGGRMPPQNNRRRRNEQEEGDFPLLLNPRDFWPEGEPNETLQNDLAAFSEFFSLCSKKALKFAKDAGHIDFSEPGQRSALVSSLAAGRIPDVVCNPENEIQWAMCPTITGGAGEFWASTSSLDLGAFVLGAISLLGEHGENIEPRLFATRLSESRQITIHRNYGVLVGNMIN